MSASRKRSVEASGDDKPTSKSGVGKAALNDVGELDGLEFEDPYGDQFEDEEYNENGSDNGAMEEESEAIDGEAEQQAPKSVWRPGVDAVPEGEELDYDPSAYVMFHSFRTEWPCLTFDFVKDTLGDNRQRVMMVLHAILPRFARTRLLPCPLAF